MRKVIVVIIGLVVIGCKPKQATNQKNQESNINLVLNKPAKLARKREALFAKYLFHYHPLFKNSASNIIELSQKDPIALLNEKEKNLN